jgi:type I restriction enzyme R subunit
MTLNENDVEHILIDQLVADHSYTYHYGPDISPYSSTPLRESFAGVVLEIHLYDSLIRLNPTLPESVIREAYSRILQLGSDDIMTNNEKFHTMLTDGISIEHFQD